MTHSARIAIIGAGNMGSALLGGLIANGYPSQNIKASHPSLEKLKLLEERLHINTSTDNVVAAKNADIIIFCVEPKVVPIVARQLATVIQKERPLVLSVAAGVQEKTIQHCLGANIAIIRAMPNTAALVGSSATALYKNAFVTETQKNNAESIFRSIGTIVWIKDEKLLDAVTALSGCGPAYFFLIIEALQEAGEQLGLPPTIARMLTLQTAYGAAKMSLDNKFDARELRQHVTSPGGSTEAAIKVLETENIRAIFLKALTAAHKQAEIRAEQLMNDLESNHG